METLPTFKEYLQEATTKKLKDIGSNIYDSDYIVIHPTALDFGSIYKKLDDKTFERIYEVGPLGAWYRKGKPRSSEWKKTTGNQIVKYDQLYAKLLYGQRKSDANYLTKDEFEEFAFTEIY